MKKLYSFFILLLITLNSFAQSVPQLTGTVIDEVGALSSQDLVEMDNQIRSIYNKGQGPQVAVVVKNTLNGYSIEDTAHKIFTTWKLGDKERDDGVLFIIALQDRKMRIEVGQGLEGTLTDYTSKQITQSIKPYLKEKRNAEAIKKALNGIMEVIATPNAVQMPANPKTSVVESNSENTLNQPKVSSAQKSIDYGGLFFALLVVGTFVFSITSVVKYNQSAKEYKKSKDHVDKVEAAHKKTIEAVTQELDRENIELFGLIHKTSKTIVTLRKEIPNAPISKKQERQIELNLERGKVKSMESDILNYQLVIKEGK